MSDRFRINEEASVAVYKFGIEQTPVIVIDNLLSDLTDILDIASNAQYREQSSDFYPGLRAPITTDYIHSICRRFFEFWKTTFTAPDAKQYETVLSALSITSKPEKQLKPIQMLPHFDTPQTNQVALVHFLCDEVHGGTGFYRHKSTETERVTEQNLPLYANKLKEEAMALKLHLNKKYIGKEHALFEMIGEVKARPNRLVIYPSNLLHSGLIKPSVDLNTDPKYGRLTTSSFVKLKKI